MFPSLTQQVLGSRTHVAVATLIAMALSGAPAHAIPNGIEKVAVANDPVPGDASGRVFGAVLDAVMNGDQVGLSLKLKNAVIAPMSTPMLMIAGSDGYTILMEPGVELPGLPFVFPDPAINPASFYNFTFARDRSHTWSGGFSLSGDAVGIYKQSVWAMRDGSLALLARAGVPAPNAGSPPDGAAGVMYAFLNRGVETNVNGDSAFCGNLVEGFGGVVGQQALFVEAPANGAVGVVHEQPNCWTLIGLDDSRNVYLDSPDLPQHTVVLLAPNGDLSAAPGASGFAGVRPRMNPVGEMAFWYSSPGESTIIAPGLTGLPTVVARAGDPAPGDVAPGASFVEMGNSLQRYIALSDDGTVYFRASLSSPETPSGYWRARSGELEPAVAVAGRPVSVANPALLPPLTVGAPFGEWRFSSFGDLAAGANGDAAFLGSASEGLGSTQFSGLFYVDSDGLLWLVAYTGMAFDLGAQGIQVVDSLSMTLQDLFTASEHQPIGYPLSAHGLVFIASLSPPGSSNHYTGAFLARDPKAVPEPEAGAWVGLASTLLLSALARVRSLDR